MSPAAVLARFEDVVAGLTPTTTDAPYTVGDVVTWRGLSPRVWQPHWAFVVTHVTRTGGTRRSWTVTLDPVDGNPYPRQSHTFATVLSSDPISPYLEVL